MFKHHADPPWRMVTGDLEFTLVTSDDGDYFLHIDGSGVRDNGDGCPNIRISVNEAVIYDDTDRARRADQAFGVCVDNAVSDEQYERTIELTQDFTHRNKLI